ncbi:MAG: DUF1570 domain-containing protein [Planctomycetia bacterium]|nr:DUF1570 domain-containing protein [Planctomycetia bacterium]
MGCALLIALLTPGSLYALEHVTLRRGDQQQTVSGKVAVTAEDGGLLLMTVDGTLWTIEPEELVDRKEDQQPFHPLSRDELAKQMLSELPAGFEVYTTHHYLICHNTSREYAAWCGALFERLYKAFTNFWVRKGIKLHDPEFPLVAIIFNTRESYAKFAQAELGPRAPSIVGYYSLRSNRVTMYDLTGIESLRAAGDRRSSAAQINQMLAQPAAEQVVATIIHEATHQIAFNSGLQPRFADIPLWVSEGIAVYFETPDLQSAKGWRNIGAVNTSRLDRFRQYLPQRPATSLKTLISDDKRMRDSHVALDAYAEAWALNYYLIRHHPKQYLAYLQMLSEKQQMLWDDPQSRLKEFQAAFGDNLGQLDADFLRQMQKVR